MRIQRGALRALDHQRLEVGGAVVAGPAVLEHDIDDAQHLLCAGDDGALVATPGGKHAVVGLELAPLSRPSRSDAQQVEA